MSNDTVALCSVVNDPFVPGFICMERSLRRTNPDWDFPLFVFYEDNICPLSAGSKQLIEKYCDNVRFIGIDVESFAEVFEYARTVIGTPERLMPAFFILEAFRMKTFGRVICLDSDILIRGSLDELLITDFPFSAVRAADGVTNEPRSFVNTGLMVIGEPLLRDFGLCAAIQSVRDKRPAPGSGKADQAIINMLFDNDSIGYLPRRFNYTKRMLMIEAGALNDCDAYEAFLTARDVRMFHYVGEKPWNLKVRNAENGYGAIEELWTRELMSFADRDLLVFLDDMRRSWFRRYADAASSCAGKNEDGGKGGGGHPRELFEKQVAKRMGL
ncbi:MAG TPA: glycosyltransferase [Candidatus Defluviicoccus seviourii]|nr:glycosyltransferase [Candidatus Defluviicoccus seviourii]